jgi:hypothetical protein
VTVAFGNAEVSVNSALKIGGCLRADLRVVMAPDDRSLESISAVESSAACIEEGAWTV